MPNAASWLCNIPDAGLEAQWPQIALVSLPAARDLAGRSHCVYTGPFSGSGLGCSSKMQQKASSIKKGLRDVHEF